MPEGRQSPAPEQQSGRQQQDPPASGHGINKTDDKDPKSQLENLSSNPKGLTDDIVDEKFSKTEKK
ncbi:hypothetical protein FOQG_01337 [Fusarium oxysporum f. sp. raphani 54005]|uniref:Uncharacterized protein n=11 Tax=Fusarium oxysporum TaxID=5507 RepID=W9I7V5_FUSOX|nr:hypothetical protein FOXG_18560 [Fusarium oxysporum f. sp. lycopersici 4287]XP_018237631.1 hypothetical protein FOXG_18560 [Fusarium oxysporum f. sp. lycopersici 4287]EWY88983.1 hypothetical protein FOYG_09968 [Fusarium oxysporum NRRL 32931]EWZ39495.1 hypothetical protein FOZG_08577 [Fusarium oxysporum Fo47]EWZ88408.1 hypothetical protein FOWG_09882 [Fusarium oxysporum f. sp. lycopersici MN25]EXA40288.1 hypothetical protein FOVG_09182 [Fusarium oxysporum f. sp. pisi HDV247]EXK31127.1 hypot